jgi:serine/threonine-protein kinase
MTPAAFVGTVLDGKFQIEKPLASGAAGDVYEALHLGLNSRVAVKVLRPGVPETADIRRKRFMREARVAARIRSDHVVRVFDIVAPERGPTYIVMELLQGETLAQRVRRVGALPAAEAVDYIVQAAKPLGEMHEAGIVHRDVKPSNLFLARDADGKTRIKLLDFGVAAFQQPVARNESSITLSEAIVGTPRYMAPEQVQSSKRIDARADVWALGVTLYELLAGGPPFDGQTVLAVLNQIENQEPRRLADRRPDLPAPLVAFVHACLAKDPEKRPADARAVADALVAFSSNGSHTTDDVAVVPSRPSFPGIGGGLFSPSRRRRLVFAASAVVAGVVILAFAMRFSREAQTPSAAAAPLHPATPAATVAATVVATPPPTTTFVPSAADSSVPASALPVASPSPTSSSSFPSSLRENATAHRPTETARPPATSSRPGGKPPQRPSPAKTGPRRPSSEDDDRIE